VSAILGLLPACNPERLLLVNVYPGGDLSPAALIATLQGRTSLPGDMPGPLVSATEDGGAVMYPQILGIYLRAHSGIISVHVSGRSPDGSLTAAGRIDKVTLNDERTQVAGDLFLHPCSGPTIDPQLCGMLPLPDGGDAGGDAEAGTDAVMGPDADADTDTDSGIAAVQFDAGPIPPECTQYCAGIVAACSALFSSGQPECEESCAAAHLQAEEVTCRITATPATFAPVGCIDASLVSRARCAPGPCNVYCGLGVSVCGAQFSDADCQLACSRLPIGNPAAPRGDDSLLCRMSWLQEAIGDQTKCARALPAGPCQAQ
jgi:hypothetical protein